MIDIISRSEAEKIVAETEGRLQFFMISILDKYDKPFEVVPPGNLLTLRFDDLEPRVGADEGAYLERGKILFGEEHKNELIAFIKRLQAMGLVKLFIH